MTDKQIIIDGVDVSGCIVFNNKWGTSLCNHTDDIREAIHCSDSPNCLYKKFKRKEQEYKELRQYHNKCCEENTKKETEWLEKYNQVSRDFYNGKYCDKENCSLLKTKEQECEELKIYIESNEQQVKEVETLVMDNDRLINELDQLKAENEELKQFLSKEPLATQALQSAYSSYKKRSDVFYEMVKQYKQTLAEIKEIAEEKAKVNDWLAIDVLKIINEVINE